MFDARTFPRSLDGANRILKEEGAVFRGEYVIHDTIFASKDSIQNLGTIFLRLRHIPKNIWSEKEYIVVIKNTEIKEVGKQSIIPIKNQFDIETEAREFIENNYSVTFEYAFEFDRTGWQYDMGVDQVDLEDIEGNFSIEFKSPTENGLKKLLQKFQVELSEVIQGPSVIAIQDIIQRAP